MAGRRSCGQEHTRNGGPLRMTSSGWKRTHPPKDTTAETDSEERDRNRTVTHKEMGLITAQTSADRAQAPAASGEFHPAREAESIPEQRDGKPAPIRHVWQRHPTDTRKAPRCGGGRAPSADTRGDVETQPTLGGRVPRTSKLCKRVLQLRRHKTRIRNMRSLGKSAPIWAPRDL